ncbi:MAG: hypothetical protein V1760_01500 [Candidatus Peregrinibacteria bacterium]
MSKPSPLRGPDGLPESFDFKRFQADFRRLFDEYLVGDCDNEALYGAMLDQAAEALLANSGGRSVTDFIQSVFDGADSSGFPSGDFFRMLASRATAQAAAIVESRTVLAGLWREAFYRLFPREAGSCLQS